MSTVAESNTFENVSLGYAKKYLAKNKIVRTMSQTDQHFDSDLKSESRKKT